MLEPERTIPFSIYSILNFSIAHFLWNKINTAENIHITVNAALCIPLFSTIALCYLLKSEINLFSCIGLILIAVSIIINNLEQINSGNATFVGIIILVLLIGVVPVTQNISQIESAKFFLEVLIALYAIFYGFILNRATTEYKDFEKNCDVIRILEKEIDGTITCGIHDAMMAIDEGYSDSKKDDAINDIISMLSKQPINKGDKRKLINAYCTAYHYEKNTLSISEWVIIFLLSVLIVSLSFVIRNNNILSACIIISIGALICLCVSAPYDLEKKKKALFKEVLKQGRNVSPTQTS